MSHTEKLRYLYQIARGLDDVRSINSPFATQGRISGADLRIPIDQTIYIGDGLTDMPCFSVVYQNSGVALGIYKQRTKEKWGKAADGEQQGRVANLAETDYREGSELMESIYLALDSICSRILLRAKAVGD